MNKKLLALALAALMIFALAACEVSSSSTSTTTVTTSTTDADGNTTTSTTTTEVGASVGSDGITTTNETTTETTTTAADGQTVESEGVDAEGWQEFRPDQKTIHRSIDKGKDELKVSLGHKLHRRRQDRHQTAESKDQADNAQGPSESQVDSQGQ